MTGRNVLPIPRYIDNIFNRYKNTLAPYQRSQGDWPLLVQGVDVHSVKVQSKNLPANVLNTFWSYRKYDLGRGLDFNRSFVRGPLFACQQHLDHQDFEYELKIERKEYAHHAKTVTVRLFMGPRYDLKGRRYNLEEERHFMFIMDTFTVPLKVGMNTVRRRSIETPLTIDFPSSLRELRQTTENTMPFCGCGWPHHLLVNSKRKSRRPFNGFIRNNNNSEEDAVVPDRRAPPQNCRPAYIFCGLMDERYPDARPMGYPFDRRLYVSEKGHGPAFLEHLVRDVPNSAFSHIKVVHYDEVRGGVDTSALDDGDYDFSNSIDNQYIDDDHPSSSIGLRILFTLMDVTTLYPLHCPICLLKPRSTLMDLTMVGPPPGPPLPPPPPPPRTILNLRLEHGDHQVRESAPNFESGSDSSGLDDFVPKHHIDVHENIRNAIDKSESPPPPPPFHIPHHDAHVGFIDEPLPPVKRRYRSAFRSSFRSLLKTFSPIGTNGSPPKVCYRYLANNQTLYNC
ncbi:Phenoloxidase subunit 2 [Orchesella cincta]|uniref:Phenoloxidase subunit 2 n=1 Tax=Orchesella cincta TaxID=48709 RepID=A0A1D2MUJ2_ORCCI|nr:Phenoloxidase subunit 2 [Orchesella cincta]